MGNVIGRYSDLLYAQPSFLEGIGRLVDFAGLLEDYNYSATPEEADRSALTADWYAVGDDLRQVCDDFARRHQIEIRSDDSPAS